MDNRVMKAVDWYINDLVFSADCFDLFGKMSIISYHRAPIEAIDAAREFLGSLSKGTLAITLACVNMRRVTSVSQGHIAETSPLMHIMVVQ